MSGNNRSRIYAQSFADENRAQNTSDIPNDHGLTERANRSELEQSFGKNDQADISEEYRILDQYRASCKEECLELAKLRLQKEKLESVVSQFQNNNEDFCRIKELVNQAVKKSLTEHRQLLSLALLSVIDSCRRDPAKFSILYYNLPSTTSATTKTQLAEFGTDQTK